MAGVSGTLIELAKTVAKFAPLIGEVLPIPGGALIGHLIAQLFGGDLSNPQDLIAKINFDPDAKIKLEQLELQHKETLEQLKAQNFAKAVDDRESARSLDEDYLKLTGHGNPMLPFLVVLLFASLVIIIYSLIELPIQSDVKTVLVMVLTALVREIPDIYRLYFGGQVDESKN